MSTPFVSIVIPYYNKKSTINRSVQSVIDQTYTNWELIIIDDKSPEELVFNPSWKAYNIQCIKNSNNLGVGQTRQRGQNLAKGEFIAFLDADDWWESKFLDVAVLKLRENFGAIMTYFVREEKYLDEVEFRYLREALVSHKRRWQTGSVLWRKACLGIWPDWSNNEDSMFEVLCSRENNNIVRAPGCLFNQGFDSNYRLSEVGENHGEANKLKTWKYMIVNHWWDFDIRHKGILLNRLIKGFSKTSKNRFIRVAYFFIYRLLQNTMFKINY